MSVEASTQYSGGALTSAPGDVDSRELDRLRRLVEGRLEELMAFPPSVPERLAKSMRHSLLSPGKRVRAIITMLAADQVGGSRDAALQCGCATEMVHAASLILDDLPSMDDATLRRGVPANHRVYGEGTAILSAIALMNDAFGVIGADETLSAEVRAKAVARLSASIGVTGLVGGQEEDLHGVADPSDTEQIAMMQARKTGALFASAGELGVLAGGGSEVDLVAVHRFGMELGIAFQILDDLLDVLGDEAVAGKDIGLDAGKPTLVTLLGATDATKRAFAHRDTALEALGGVGVCHTGVSTQSSPLYQYAQMLVAMLSARLKLDSVNSDAAG